ncbi:hypothetical protein MHU86_9122 [Fragilaria crotonensis]|nr:hypothetical protein MHU86_9122 [Fragilaria crotonensis]
MTMMIAVILSIQMRTSSSFVILPTTTSSTTSSGTSLFDTERNSDADYGHEALLQTPKRRGFTIPVLPSTPNAIPLMMGSSLELDPPTLGQWQAMEESVVLHQKYLRGANLTAITAAPLVAVMDEYTMQVSAADGNSNNKNNGAHKVKRRYATIAAVVGISASKKTVDEMDFMEIMTQCRGTISPLRSKVRLVGVGRADLTDFFYQMPTVLEFDNDDVECLIDDDDDDEEEDPLVITDLENRQDPIVMAEFSILHDEPKSSLHSLNLIGDKGARSPNMAPVFAIHEMSKFANKVTRLHDDRRRLVNIVLAAKKRLAEHNVFDDVDGLGSILFGGNNNNNNHDDLLDETERLLQCENYGLNYYSSFCSIPQLTGVAQDVLESYYSPARRSTEEYRLEVLSFVAFRSLEGFCRSSDLAWALVCTNSIERLHRAYELMQQHYWALKDIIKKTNQDLLAVGEEECTL